MKKKMNKKGIEKYLSKNKKAAEMAIGTIIIIVLSLVVLVVLIFGFTTGWTNLWGKITAFGGGEVNVQSVIQGCQLSCTTGNRYDYCILEKNVIFGDKDKDGPYKCEALVGPDTGFEGCPAIKCETVENCENLNNRNTLHSEVNRCPAGTDVKPSADTPPIATTGGVLKKQAYCCQDRYVDSANQEEERKRECALLDTRTNCDDAGCGVKECTAIQT